MFFWLPILILLVLWCTGSDSQPVLTQPPTSSVSPGNTVKLSCVMSTGFSISGYAVYWYQQKPENPPRYLLYYTSDSTKHQGSGVPSRFSGSKDTSANTGNLSIAGGLAEDEADYYCALGPGKQMPVVGPNQLLNTPLFSKTPFLPGSNTLFYTTKVGEKLYQPSPTFDLNDPYCKLMAPKYNSLHDPHLRSFYKRKDNLKRLKKSGFVTDKNKVVCSLKEFNEYRQYLTSLKLEFEKHYIKEQKMIEKQVTTIQDSQPFSEATDTSKYRDWLLKEERPTVEEQENVMRNRYLDLINEELQKLEQLAEENRELLIDYDDEKKQGLEKRKQFLLRKKMEEEWRKKEMILMMKIGNDIKREARIEEQRQKNKEEKLKRVNVS
uniref:Uncharacterized protein n=1 Tax=Sphaerodactylus townsendi TaxID=933632 RepID=A0ACB8FYA2_9SAUR